MSEQRRILSIAQVAEMLPPDGRSKPAREMQVRRALEENCFPGARKLNPEGETSPWLIPVREAMTWLARVLLHLGRHDEALEWQTRSSGMIAFAAERDVPFKLLGPGSGP